MTFDGIYTRAVINELKKEVLGGKIQKISQPSKNDIVFNVYSRGKSYKILLSANNNDARFNISNLKYENPDVAPNFCMLLRKHLNQGKIVNIEQVGLDRIVIFSISSIDEMGFDTSKKLILEIMGKYSNLILVNDDYKIIDSIKRVNQYMSSVRQILPGLKYQLINDDKIDITNKNFYEDIFYFDQKLPNSTNPLKFFYTHYTGFSPLLSKEICYRAQIDLRVNWELISENEKLKLNQILYYFREKIINNNFASFTYSNKKKIKEFYCFELTHLDCNQKNHSNLGEAMDEFYSVNKKNDRLNQMQTDLRKKLNTNIKTIKNKILILEENIAKESKLNILKKKGDLLASNIYRISKGKEYIDVEDYYNQGNNLLIELDKFLTPWENVELYYKKYKKLKNSIEFAKSDIPKQKDILYYLNELKFFIDKSESIDNLNEIKEEMFAIGILRNKSKNKNKNIKSEPMHFKTIYQSDIFVGKNSAQNDYITLKLANKNDYFFHVKDLPGSHVILKTNKITEEEVLICSYLAAINSSISNSNKVLVDYTSKKNVNKSKGAKPGMVYYDNFKTINLDINFAETKIKDLYKRLK